MVSASFDTDEGKRALEGSRSGGKFLVAHFFARHGIFSTTDGLFSGIGIDIAFLDCHVCEDHNALPGDFDEPLANSKVEFLAIFCNAQLTWFNLGEKWHV